MAAAVAFVLEEIIGDLNSRAPGSVLLASVIGAFVVHAFIGAQPAFELPAVTEPTWRAYLLMPLVAALAALVGSLFQRSSLALRLSARKLKLIPKWLHPLLGGLVTWGNTLTFEELGIDRLFIDEAHKFIFHVLLPWLARPIDQ